MPPTGCSTGRCSPSRALRRPGRRVAVVGAGPAGLACAHALALLGHDVTVFESAAKAGGLNEYGIAAYKVAERLRAARGRFHSVDRRHRGRSTATRSAATSRWRSCGGTSTPSSWASGSARVNALGAGGRGVSAGSSTRSTYIARAAAGGGQIGAAGRARGRRDRRRQHGRSTSPSRRKRLGAEDVTIVYRRGPGADGRHRVTSRSGRRPTACEIKHWARPVRAARRGRQRAPGVEFEYTRLERAGRLVGHGRAVPLPADMVFKAIGQSFVPDRSRRQRRRCWSIRRTAGSR